MKKKYSSCFPKKNPPNSLNIQEARLHVWRGESLETRFGLKKKRFGDDKWEIKIEENGWENIKGPGLILQI